MTPVAAAVLADQVARERGLCESGLARVVELGAGESAAAFDQVADDQIVLLARRVLEVADRVDAQRIGNQPGLLRQSLDRIQDVRVEHLAAFGHDGEQHVVDLGVLVLQLLEGLAAAGCRR